MKTKINAQSEIPAAPISVVSQFASASASVAAKDDAVTDAQVRELAYKLYEDRGGVDGSDLQDWFEAESILRERGKLEA